MYVHYMNIQIMLKMYKYFPKVSLSYKVSFLIFFIFIVIRTL